MNSNIYCAQYNFIVAVMHVLQFTKHHYYASRPSLPSNILELGDPDLVPQVMPIQPEEEEEEDSKKLPTLSKETLAELWEKYIINAPQIQ